MVLHSVALAVYPAQSAFAPAPPRHRQYLHCSSACWSLDHLGCSFVYEQNVAMTGRVDWRKACASFWPPSCTIFGSSSCSFCQQPAAAFTLCNFCLQAYCDRQKQQCQSTPNICNRREVSQLAVPRRVQSQLRRGTNQHLAWSGRWLLPSRDQTRPRDPAVKERRPAIDSRVCWSLFGSFSPLGNHLLLKTLLTR